MTEIFLIEILVSLGVISLLSYIIYINVSKNQKHQKINEKEIELIRIEKELDRTDAIQRGL